LTKRLVEAQGGSVGVRSTPGQGSVFFAVLPRRAAESAGQKATFSPVIQRAGAPRVLVVEDNPADQSALVRALTEAGYAIEVAATGGEALTRCREQSFDAITLDLLLPDMSGLEVLQALRAGVLNHDIPVIVITVVAETGAVAGFAVHDILPTPIDPEHLVDSLRRAGVTSSGGGFVLVVDDDPGALKLISTTLQRLGIETRCEPDGARALEVVRSATPDAIVLDLVMPEMSGFEFLDRFRQEPSGKGVPVIIWTAKDLSPREHASLRQSAQAVVAKGRGASAAVVSELRRRIERGR
jgi:CheY-like chemotaxis protein